MRLSDMLLREETTQVSSLSHIFEEEPVPLDVFISDQAYLNNPPLSPIQFDVVQHVERIYLPSLYPLMAEEFGGYWAKPVRMTNLITAEWGKGGGKDHTIRIGVLRAIYLLLCLRSPQEYFSMPTQDSIHLLNIAANAGQANRAFFTPMTRAVKRGWFADKAQPTRDTIQFAKNIEAVSGHSDAESQEGMNIIIGVADEIDAFKTRDEKVGTGKRAREASTSAEAILEMIKTSASTRFPESYKRIAISYPRYKGSMIQRLRMEAEQDIKEVGPEKSIYYASGPYATWEVNPRVPGKHAFASDYRKDPVAAAAKYECAPSLTTDAYFRNFEVIEACATEEPQPVTVDYERVLITSMQTGAKVENWEAVFSFAENFKPIPGALYGMHADLAIKGDRAGVALSHVSRYEEIPTQVMDEDGFVWTQITTVPHVRNDFTISLEADIGATPAREIQIRWVRALAFELIRRGFPLALVTYDGFQSADTLQILSSHGVPTDKRSTDKDPSIWKTVKDMASEGRLRFPHSTLLLNELRGLNRVGEKVDHPPGGSKDEADAFACSIVNAVILGGQEGDVLTESQRSGPLFSGGTDRLFGLEGDAPAFDDGFAFETDTPMSFIGEFPGGLL